MIKSTLFVSILLAAAAACTGDDAPGPDASEPRFVLGTMVFSTDGTTSYVSVLDSLESQTIDLAQAREFSGLADVWVHDGAVFVTELETLTIAKFEVVGAGLEERGRVSFAAYGLTDFGFWLNTFVSPTKAYFLHGADELIVWDPSAMEITGTVPLPTLEAREGFQVFPAYADRAARVRDGLLYQPLYWTDQDYFRFTPDSRIAVFDTATDELVDVLEAPCPGIDFATEDDAGDLYFSSWVFAPGGAATLDQPATCVVRVAADSDATATHLLDVGALTEGREGGAMRHVGGSAFLLSVLHDDHATGTDPAAVTYGANWRFWSYDAATGAASQIDAIDWNAGGAYATEVDGARYLLVPATDYSATTVYRLGADAPEPAIETPGWAVRLFEIDPDATNR
jgi:hypothetical protein